MNSRTDQLASSLPPVTVGFINMQVGNLSSIQRAFLQIGLQCREIESASELENFGAVVIPGVGAFRAAIDNLNARDFTPALRKIARRQDIPILGICLGMQLLADESEEYGLSQGLGLIAGRVTRLQEQEIGGKVPNIGWCRTQMAAPSAFCPEGCGVRAFYYNHSFHFTPHNPATVVATTRLGSREVVAAVEQGSVAGIQFHPEKSQDDGMDLLHTWAIAKRLLPASA